MTEGFHSGHGNPYPYENRKKAAVGCLYLLCLLFKVKFVLVFSAEYFKNFFEGGVVCYSFVFFSAVGEYNAENIYITVTVFRLCDNILLFFIKDDI